MKLLARLLPFLALALASGPAFADEEIPANLVKAEILADAPADGAMTLAVRLQIHEGWHVYWVNPGDSGLPTRVEWTLPKGYEAGPLQFPTPHVSHVGPIINYGYEKEAILLTSVATPAGAKAGASVPVKAEVSWLVCQDTCIPGRATIEKKIKIGDAGPKELADAKAALALPSPWPITVEDAGKELVLFVAAPALSKDVDTAYFFSEATDAVEHAAEQKLSRDADGLRLRLQKSSLAEGPIGQLDGILALGKHGEQAVLVQGVKVGPVSAATTAAAGANVEKAAPAAAAADQKPAEEGPGLLEVLGLALLGGLILNLMPCVFPVLSLKVLGVAQQASETPGRIRLHGVAYTAGILASFGALASMLLLLRAGGSQIGWGFQLQSPAFVAVLAYVLFAMALSLSGVLHFGGSIVGVGNSLATRPGLPGSFFTGVLATVVATPCTAPFMGAAIGYAILQPAVVALSIFLALGLGLALPFLVLSFVPSMHRVLPRPGAWMETLKQALAFPLYGTVAWLVWVLQLQVGPDGLAAVLAGLVLVGLAAWAWGSSRLAGNTMKRVGAATTVLAAVGAVLLVQLPASREAEATAAAPKAGGEANAHYEPWTPSRFDELRKAGKPVFVNFTAAWCVTCLVNERTAMGTDDIRSLFSEKGVTYLKGDWTNRDPAITKELEKFGRSGVPLYLYYGPESEEPKVLPQVLTPETVREYVVDAQ